MKITRRRMVEAAAFAFVLVAPLVGAISPLYGAGASALDVEVSIEPTEQHDVYRCDATLRDAASGETLAAPTVIFKSGQDATVAADLENGQGLRLSVRVAEHGDSATYRAELLDGGKVISSQRATIHLRPSA